MSDDPFAPDEFAYVGLKPDSQELVAPDKEPSHFIHHHEGHVVLFDDDKTIEIGNFRAFYIDVDGAICARVSPFDVFDTMQETYDYLELYDLESLRYTADAAKASKAGYLLYEPNLLILDRLEILPRYRGRGYGLQSLVAMMHWFQAGAGLVAMKPFPLQFESHHKDRTEPDPLELVKFTANETTARTKLRRYYAQLGFRLVAKTEMMVRRVDQAPPVLPAAFGGDRS